MPPNHPLRHPPDTPNNDISTPLVRHFPHPPTRLKYKNPCQFPPTFSYKVAIIFPNTYTQRAYKHRLKRPVDAYETVVKGECKYTETRMDISRRACETMFREMQRVSEKIQLYRRG